jgi:uncharacterized secreted protein with C-terminal beta-propeller domain
MAANFVSRGIGRRAWMLACLLTLVVLPGSAAGRAPHHRANPHRRAALRVRPRAFASCANLVGYAQSHFAVTHGYAEPPVRPFNGPALLGPPQATNSPASPSPATQGASTGTGGAGTTYSTTNNQEVGVDEPDTVKTDGSTIFTVSQGTLYAVDAKSATPRLLGSLALGANGFGAQLLLRGSRLVVISGAGGPVGVGLGVATPASASPRAPAAIAPISSIYPSPYYYRGTTTLTEVDVQDPAAMKVARTLTVDGTFVDARQNGGTARFVIASAPQAIANPALRASPRGWVPTRSFHSVITGRHYVRSAPCNFIAHPVDFSGLGMLTILTANLDKGLWVTDGKSVMADAQVVYGSQSNLYVATQKWINPGLTPNQVPSSQQTVIDKFNVTDPDHTTFVSSGEVPGYVLNQFSMSEDKGYLRVATTSRPIWWGGGLPQGLSQSYVTVLSDQSGALVPVGQVSGLGAGQQIYSVRFVGDSAYIVTFRRVDPLYVLDLQSPTAPRVVGQLELEGYSSYLHPLGGGLLLGVGQDVGSGNEPSGAQLELFDVSSPSSPKLLQKTTLGSGSSSEVSYDHHAFLYWPPTKLAVLPVQIYSISQGPIAPAPGGTTTGSGSSTQSSQSFVGAIGFHLDQTGISELGRVTQDAANGSPPAITRSLVIGDRLFTISDQGVMASSLSTLARQAFVALPAPTVSPGSGGTGSSGPAAR